MNLIKKNKTAIGVGVVSVMLSVVFFLGGRLSDIDKNKQRINQVGQTAKNNEDDIDDLQKSDGQIKAELKSIKSDTSWLKKRFQNVNK